MSNNSSTNVKTEIDTLGNRVAELNHLVAELSGRLEVVLLPEPKENPAGVGQLDTASAMASMLADRNAGLADANRKLAGLLKRIDL